MLFKKLIIFFTLTSATLAVTLDSPKYQKLVYGYNPVTEELPGIPKADWNFAEASVFTFENLTSNLDLAMKTMLGISSDNAPKVYRFDVNGSMYSPELSVALARAIKSGLVSNREYEVSKRDCPPEHLTFNYCSYGGGPCTSYSRCGINRNTNKECVSSPNTRFIEIRDAGETYITFWASGACNGKKVSVSPTCKRDNNYHSCASKERVDSFRVYAGCHQHYDEL